MLYSLLLFGALYTIVVSSHPTSKDVKNKFMCLDTTIDITGDNLHQWTPCEWTNQDIIFNRPHLSYLRIPTTNQQRQKKGITAPIDITFNCLLEDHQICGKAERAFEKVGKMISDVILFREPVNVNATLMSFCETGGECGEHMMTLGGSSPVRAMPLLNDDGLLRLHPQALVKQFGLADHPAFAPYDILSVFNSDAPFWFEEDGVPIGSTQVDFSFVILHEFMHGLGFYSGWNEYVSAHALTPDPSPFLANQLILMVNPTTNAIHPDQFLESAMDRLLRVIKVDGKSTSISVSEYTKNLNRIQASSLAELVKNPAFDDAKEMDKLSTEAGSLGIQLYSEQGPIILETSLHPFQPGSSISHVSYANYTNTPDFLMRFMQDRGLTLDEAVKRGGGESPIGPLLMRVFEEIGYATIENPDTIPPLLILQSQSMEHKLQKNSTEPKHGIRRKNQHHRPGFQYESSSPTNQQFIMYYTLIFSIIFYLL